MPFAKSAVITHSVGQHGHIATLILKVAAASRLRPSATGGRNMPQSAKMEAGSTFVKRTLNCPLPGMEVPLVAILNNAN